MARAFWKKHGSDTELYLAKVDADAAFRSVPVRRADWWLQVKQYRFTASSKVRLVRQDGDRWRLPVPPELGESMAGRTLWMADVALTFGGRPSPFWYCHFSNAIRDALRRRGVFCVQYVDDGMVGGAGPEECLHSRDLMIEHMEGVGFVVSAKKLEEEGTPTTCLVYIGVQIDTVAREFRLDPQRLEQTRVMARRALTRDTMVVRDVQSMLGKLVFAASVIQPGRLFTRRIWASIKGMPSHHHVRFDTGAREDLEWWRDLLHHHNGIAAIPEERWVSFEQLDMATDASGCIGLGGYLEDEYFADVWTEYESLIPVNVQELFAVLVALTIWGPKWRGRRIRLRTDSEVAVKVAGRWSAKEPLLCKVLREVYFAAAVAGCEIRLEHLAGVLNVKADHLSRDRVSAYLNMCERVQTRRDVPSTLQGALGRWAAKYGFPGAPTVVDRPRRC